MKKLFILSGVALMVSSALSVASSNKNQYDFASLDSNSNGEISQTEAKGKLADNFTKIDKDGNGSISLAEFDAIKAMRQGKNHHQKSFTDLDTDKDGFN